jgi:hypothetical protein
LRGREAVGRVANPSGGRDDAVDGAGSVAAPVDRDGEAVPATARDPHRVDLMAHVQEPAALVEVRVGGLEFVDQEQRARGAVGIERPDLAFHDICEPGHRVDEPRHSVSSRYIAPVPYDVNAILGYSEAPAGRLSRPEACPSDAASTLTGPCTGRSYIARVPAAFITVIDAHLSLVVLAAGMGLAICVQLIASEARRVKASRGTRSGPSGPRPMRAFNSR